MATWRKANLTFLVALGSGMLTSIFALANLLQHLLADYPVQVWSFFFGLVAASVVLVARFIPRWNANLLIAGAIGIAAAGWITSLPPLMQSDSLFFLALCGSIAIIAMILPGISGSFLLLSFGLYESTIAAVNDRNFGYLAVFALGAIFGLAVFVSFLRWLLDHHARITMAIIVGLMLGSLRALWPWQDANRNLLAPTSDILSVVLLALAGVAVVAVLLWVERRLHLTEAEAEEEAADPAT